MELTTVSLAAPRTRTTPALFNITDGPADADGEILATGATPSKVISTLTGRGISAKSALAAMKFAVEECTITLTPHE